MRYIKVFAPGTVANLGCGFDVMGLTLDGVGDLLEVGIEEGAGGARYPQPQREGTSRQKRGQRDYPGGDGTARGIRKTRAGRGYDPRKDRSRQRHRVECGFVGRSGLGRERTVGTSFSGERLVEFAMMGEALIGGTSHADNVGPAVLGGVVLIRGYEPLDIVRLPVPEGFFYAVVHPDIVVSTKQAREVLPREVPLHDAVTQWGNVGGLVAGFALGDVALIGRSMHDVVAEPYRKGFIPGYDALKEQVLAGGALAMNIAGSGPSVFALASNYEAAVRISGEMKRHFEGLGIGCNSYAGRVSNCGAKDCGIV